MLACAKHYPGHGRTRHDSHQGLPVVQSELNELSRTDLAPFATAIDAGVASIMTAHVAYPEWDPSGLPATRSPVILGHLRSVLGFDGLLVTDALIMEGARGGHAEGQAVLEALRAGSDMLLYPANLVGVVQALCGAVERDAATTARVKEALARYERALATAFAGPTDAMPPDLSAWSAESMADRLLERGLLRGALPDLRGGIRLEVVDDDLGGWYAPGPSNHVPRSLARRKLFESWEGRLVVLALAEPRAAKGRAGFGPESKARIQALVAAGAALVVLFGHPRLLAEIPGECPVLCAWHRQPLMQEAVARWLEERVKGEQ